MRPEGRTLYLRLPDEGWLFQRIQDLFALFPGDSPTVLFFAATGRRKGATCLLHDALLAELRELLGDGTVVLR